MRNDGGCLCLLLRINIFFLLLLWSLCLWFIDVYCTLGSGPQFGWTFPGDHLASQLPHHISRLTCQPELPVQDLLGAMEICGKRGVKHVWKERGFPTEREPVKTNGTHIKQQ